MNWKNEAMERLGQLSAARCAAENLECEVRRLEEALNSPGSPRLTPGGASKTREDWQLGKMVLLEQTRNRLSQTRSWLAVTQSALDSLPEEERLVLQRLFVQPRKGGVEELCREMNTERSSVYRRREQALRNFTLALYGPC